MDFGEALNALKGGKKVARSGWNGKGMWLFLSDGVAGVLPRATDLQITLVEPLSRKVEYRPCIFMKDAQDMLVPWLASQTDMLAEDWEIV